MTPENSPRSNAESDISTLVLATSESDLRSQVAKDIAVPALPSNLDDFSRKDLQNLLCEHHAKWLQCASKLVSTPASDTPGGKQDLKNFKNRQKRRVRYWKNKSKRQKKQSEQQLQLLKMETEVYVQSKRRKKTAFRMRMSVFGGMVRARNYQWGFLHLFLHDDIDFVSSLVFKWM